MARLVGLSIIILSIVFGPKLNIAMEFDKHINRLQRKISNEPQVEVGSMTF